MTRKQPRLLIIAAFGALATLASFAALAWACTPSAYINVRPTSGPAGSSMTVTGDGFVARPVEVTWSGGGVLATGAGPKFSTSVKVPNAPPGVYYIKATARNADGTVAGSASRAFQLTAAAPRRSPSQAPTKRVAHREVGNRDSGRSRGTAPRADAAPAVTTRSGARAVAGTSRVERPAPATPARATSKARGDSGKQAGSPRSDRGPSARSANGDLWSGFNAGIPRDAGLLGRSAPTAAPGSQLIPGLALLGLGVMALAGGLGVAVMRRRAAASRTP